MSNPVVSRGVKKALSRALRVPPPRTDFRVERRVPVPMRDGVQLIADHYIPETDRPAGTLLVRGPYGRRWPFSALYASVYATRGYHVVLQSVRGTFGSGGHFDPTVNEVADGADTAAWLRYQPWYTGSFGTVGLSYLGATQWALLQDPPPDMAAAVVVVGVHDFAASSWGTGSFSGNDFLGWSNMVSHQEDPGVLRTALRQARAGRVVAKALDQVPLAETGRQLLGAGAPWWESWVEHPAVEDPFWDRYRFQDALDRTRVPILLIGGWQDLFLEQTLEQYRRLRARDVDVAMTIGPWTHSHMTGKAAPAVLRESLGWLDRHLAGLPTPPRSRVRVAVTGGGRWHELAEWPPVTTAQTWYLESGRLTRTPAPESAVASSSFTFDPRHPTPTVGGRLLSAAGGRRRDDSLAARADVLAVDSDPLATEVHVYGAPVLELDHASDNPYVDVFVRVSEVDAKGRSRNLSDGYRRLVCCPGDAPVRLELDEIAHRFAAGSRIRVLVAGGSHPRYARNLGTGEHPARGTAMRPATHTIGHRGRSRLLLPVGAARPSTD
ncbi:CocE/NonD family hydrolase [[Mycobacterium] burgundiense]|uniref:CocE/NonD family hydrolase n=1 Tax=[Mycobacterium] burgundiense TaxID=3064286 RepID=UPI0035A063F0